MVLSSKDGKPRTLAKNTWMKTVKMIITSVVVINRLCILASTFCVRRDTKEKATAPLNPPYA